MLITLKIYLLNPKVTKNLVQNHKAWLSKISRVWLFSKIHFLSTLDSVDKALKIFAASPCIKFSKSLKVLGLLFYLYIYFKWKVPKENRGTGMDPPTIQNIGWFLSCTSAVLTQKWWFCNFHAVFGHFNRTVPPHQLKVFWKLWNLTGKTMICVTHWQ